MTKYVNGLGVNRLWNLDAPGDWENVSGRRGTNFPVYSHSDRMEALIVGVGISQDATFVGAHHLGGSTTFSSPLFTASTDGEAAEEVLDYMEANP